MSLSPSSSPSRKRKHADVVAADSSNNVSPHKKAKKDKKAAKESKKALSKEKGKGKSKAGVSDLDSEPGSGYGQFQIVNASILVSIPPKFSLNPLSGAKEMLDSLVMKYVPALQGVLLCHSNARFLSRNAQLKNECPFLICTVSFDATVWSPQVGMKLTGKTNLCSPDHISLLVHRTFNVSIPREHIPTENWAFEYGPAENDPEVGPHAAVSSETNSGARDGKADVNADAVSGADEPAAQEQEQDDSGPHGSWVHRITSDRLGGKDGLLEFTVIGLTVANNMLSLKGSLQPDPFSPHHVPQPAIPPVQLEVEGDEEEERDEVEKLVVSLEYSEYLDTGAPQEDDESEIEEDPFAQLGLAKEEALERQAAEKRRAEEEKAREKEERKKRKKERRERKEKEKALAGVDGLPAPQDPALGQDAKLPKKKTKKGAQEA